MANGKNAKHDIITYFPDCLPQHQSVQVSFEMPYLDWCKFEKSQTWANLLAVLEDCQSK